MDKISVIIPAYNMESFLEKCLKSIINQTHKNLEIIVVNDCSTDSTLDICETFASIDERIKIVNNRENKGLFHTRLEGTKVATGDYIAFVDGDDYLTLDYYRVMLNKADNADMIIGNTVLETEEHWKYVTNMTRIFTKHTSNNGVIEGENILGALMDGEGLNFSWHTVWNKLYKKELWDKCVPYYEKITTHLIMTEDIAFSTVLYNFATKLKFVDVDGYMYYRHSKASTGAMDSIEKLEKTINDLCLVFVFVENFLKEVNKYDRFEAKFKAFRQRYCRFWSGNVEKYSDSIKGKAIKRKFLETFQEDDVLDSNKDDSYFSSIVTGYEQNYIFIKEAIINKATKYVSFDIFDTLLVRPFLEPSDLFLFMQTYFVKLTGNTQNFLPQRQEAESIARSNMSKSKPFFEDVNIDEIYETFGELYGYSNEICESLKQKEIELELHFCYPRKSIKELYELAKHLGKEILIVSDMYLPKSVIEKLLEKNGYTGYTKLYVSSDTRVLKHTQNMYKHVCRDLKIKNKKSILHIGDNHGADIVAAESYGLRSFHTEKTKDLFLGNTSYKKNLDTRVFCGSVGDKYNNTNARKNLSIRCMLAVIANKMFDNPFPTYAKNTAMNANPYYIGYFLLGMNMYGLANWLKTKDASTIHFIARDGYLPKKIYDIVATKDSPKSNYLYASRKSLLPTLITKPEDLLILPELIETKNHTPASILSLFSNISNELTPEIESLYKNEGVLFDSALNTRNKFLAFVDAFTKISFNEEKAKQYKSNTKTYFQEQIKENDCTFDLGYSGKIQKMICDVAEKSIKTYFLHGNGAETEAFAKQHQFEVETFYQTTPNVSGIVREYLVSDYNPSCIGYDDSIKPVFEDGELSYSERYILDQVHNGTVDFASDFTRIFDEYLDMFNFHPIECSQALEHFLAYPTHDDMRLFDCAYVEDSVHSGKDSLTLNACWRNYLHQSSIGTASNVPTEIPLTEIDGIYLDGLIIALAKKINQIFPEGGRKRKFMKKIMSIFIRS